MPNKPTANGFNNGKLCPINEIRIPVDNLAIARAYAVYEFFKIIGGKAFYLERHLDRLFNSLKLLNFNIAYTRKELEDIIIQLVKENGTGNFQMKIYAIPMNLAFDQCPSNIYIIPCQDPPFSPDIYLKGANLLMKEYCRFIPKAKSTNYIASVFWQAEMDEMNAVDVLYYKDDAVLESSRGNIFIVKGNQVFTSSENILHGITRSIVLDLMDASGISYTIRTIGRNELTEADEVFITSTTKLIMPIVKINHLTIGKGIPGPVSTQISNMYLNLLV
jgi:branched-chain amino acid aminotransferase